MKLVEVWWVDSAGPDGWQYRDDDPPKPIKCRTAGYLLRETKDHVVIAATLNRHQTLAPVAIPKAVITKRRRLR